MEFHKAGYEPEVVVSDTSSLCSDSNDRSLLSFTATPQKGQDSLETTPPKRRDSLEVTPPKRRDSLEVTPPKRRGSLETTPPVSREPSSETISRGSSGPSDDVITHSDSEDEEPTSKPGIETSPREQAPPTSSPLPSSISLAKECTPRLLRRNGTRQFYNEDFNYIIDAKSHGNMARYINVSDYRGYLSYLLTPFHTQHSCDPNLFVQNVFVDTHDLRFPWVAFFTKR